MAVNRSEALQNALRHASRGDLPAAAAIYRQIIEGDPFDFATINALGELYVKAGRSSDAVAEFFKIAEGYFTAGLDVNAAYVLKKILELDPFNAQVQMKLGDIYDRQGMKDKACESYLGAEVAFTRAGKLDAALVARTKALTLKPPAAMVTAPLQSESPLEPVARAQQTHSERFSHQTQQHLDQQTVHADQGSRSGNIQDDGFVVQQLSKAEMLVGYGDVNGAVNMLKEALRQRPDNVNIRIKLKDIYLRSAMMDKAGEECFEIARLFSAMGDAERARDYAVRARRLTQSAELPASPSADLATDASSSTTPPSTTAESLLEVTQASEQTRTSAPEPRLSPTQERVPVPAPERAPTVTKEPERPVVETRKPIKPLMKPAEPAVVAPVSNQAKISPQPLRKLDRPSTADFMPIAVSTVAPTIAPTVAPPTNLAVRSATVPAARTAVPTFSAVRSPEKKRRPGWLYATAISGTCLILLGVAAIRIAPSYEAGLDREFQELMQANPLPSPPSLTETAVAEAQPQEQVEVSASDSVTAPPPLESAKPTPPPPPQRANNEPAPEPTRVAQVSAQTERPGERKTPAVAPPMVAAGSIGQGVPEGGAPAGVSAALPGKASNSPEPPPPPARPPSTFVKGEAITRSQPEYPSIAKSAGQSGAVSVEVNINEKGDVVSARAVSGPQMLREAATSAARRWKFRPSIRDGRPVASSTTIVFNFKR